MFILLLNEVYKILITCLLVIDKIREGMRPYCEHEV